jgi:hypothetical protein
MFCTNCGRSLDDSATVCPACGAQVEATVPAGAIPNHLVAAILVTLFCCVPAGIVAIVYASQVNSKLASGDIEGALSASRTAKGWILGALGVGVVIMLFYVVAAIAGSK